MAWISGQRLQGGKYTIEQELGKGGFGITYRALDENGRKVVIKTLNDQVQRRPDFAKFQQDFLNEALRLARCSHPHIVRIEEVIQQGTLCCMVMEYIDGEDLAFRVENQGALPETEALRYTQQIANALAALHSNGLLHRDVKPQNIMLRGNNDAVLIDFGIAREFIPNLTQRQTQFLVHGFAAIEQYYLRGKRGAYTDVYGLAATLYFMLTGELPTIAPARAAGMPLEPPQQINPSISDMVNQAIHKGMEVKPEKRPQSLDQWLELMNMEIGSTAFNYEPTPQTQTPSVELISALGVDYRRLRDLLAARKWKEADEETLDRMLEAAGQPEIDYLLANDIAKFPCEDLRTIDQLWVHYSNGLFGFSVQKRIWESVNDEREFGDRIGRRVHNYWLEFKDLTFNLNAPPGHLPYANWYICRWAIGRLLRFWSRLKACALNP